jgi:hypothetical protein
MGMSGTGVPEERVAALEKKVRDMDALANGLLNELLDVKKTFSTMSRPDGKDAGQKSAQGSAEQDLASPASADSSASPDVAAGSGTSTVILSRGKSQPELPAEPEMVRIMQADGTMKMEPRYGDDKTTDPSKGNERLRKSTALRNRKVS